MAPRNRGRPLPEEARQGPHHSADPPPPSAKVTTTVTQDDDIGADVNTWINVLRRSRLHATTKLIAFIMASYASPDGTNIYPGTARIAIQARCSYRTVQVELQRLRAAGLIQAMPRLGMRRSWSTRYRLILGPDLLEKVDVPSPATEDAAVDHLAARYRGRHRPKSARSPECAQIDDCTQWDGATARNGQSADLQEAHQTLHVPLPEPNPPSAESSVVARGTGSARAREADGEPHFIDGNPEQDHKQAELARLEAWMKENAQ